MSHRKSTLYADLLNNRPKVTLKGHIGALIHLLYKLFYSKTGYFISGFYCIWATKIADKIFFLPQSWHAHDSGMPGNPALGLLLPPGSARFRPPRSPPPPPLSVCPRPLSPPLEAARSFSSPQFSWGVRRVGRVSQSSVAAAAIAITLLDPFSHLVSRSLCECRKARGGGATA